MPTTPIDLSARGDRLHYDHADAPLCRLDDGPLRGLRHRTVIDRESGSDALAVWQEEHEPGFLVPPHRHDCEEVITVIEGEIRARVGEAEVRVGPWQSVRIPAWAAHGFEVTSARPVRLLAIFASSDPMIFRVDGSESIPPWRGGASIHLEPGGQ